MKDCNGQGRKCSGEEQNFKVLGSIVEHNKALAEIKDLIETWKEKCFDVPISSEDILEELFDGYMSANADYEGQSQKPWLKEIIPLQDKLREKMTRDQWKIYLEQSAPINKHLVKENLRMFKNGFRVAVLLLAAGLSPVETENEEESKA